MPAPSISAKRHGTARHACPICPRQVAEPSRRGSTSARTTSTSAAIAPNMRS